MANLKELEHFTQRAYLEVAAIKKDSVIFDDPQLALVKCSSIKERWTNAVVRAIHQEQDFPKLDQLIETYDREQINFNWHIWQTSSSPKLRNYLFKEKKLISIGEGGAFYKKLPDVVHPPAQSTAAGFFVLDSNFLQSYVEAKVRSWKIADKWRKLLFEISSAQISDPNRAIYVVIKENQVIAAAGAYIKDNCAYLRGSFCDPDYRGLDYYKKLVYFREAELHKRGVNFLTTLADAESSAPILQKLGYECFSNFDILARHESEWVSL